MARRAWSRPVAASAAALLLLLVLVALLAPVLAPGDIDAQDLGHRLRPPGWADETGRIHWAGTDQLGRDITGRLIHGSRVSLLIGAASVLLGGGVGLAVGLVAGFYGGRLDATLMRLTDMQLAFPFMLMALALVTILGPGVGNVVLVLAITSWVNYAKVIRGEALKVAGREYVHAAVALGLPTSRVVLHHILPNVLPVFSVIASFQVAALIIAESSLSFLGLGVPNTVPTWGSMLADGRDYVSDAWWLSVFPGVAIMAAALSFNVLGDGLRDWLDPATAPIRRTRRFDRRRPA